MTSSGSSRTRMTSRQGRSKSLDSRSSLSTISILGLSFNGETCIAFLDPDSSYSCIVQLSHRLKRKQLCCILPKTGYICQQDEKILQRLKQFSLFKKFSIFLFSIQWQNPYFQDLESLRGKNVLIVEDIIDTGRTMKKLLNTLNK